MSLVFSQSAIVILETFLIVLLILIEILNINQETVEEKARTFSPI